MNSISLGHSELEVMNFFGTVISNTFEEKTKELIMELDAKNSRLERMLIAISDPTNDDDDLQVLIKAKSKYENEILELKVKISALEGEKLEEICKLNNDWNQSGLAIFFGLEFLVPLRTQVEIIDNIAVFTFMGVSFEPHFLTSIESKDYPIIFTNNDNLPITRNIKSSSKMTVIGNGNSVIGSIGNGGNVVMNIIR
jgi:hypothetical protein